MHIYIVYAAWFIILARLDFFHIFRVFLKFRCFLKVSEFRVYCYHMLFYGALPLTARDGMQPSGQRPVPDLTLDQFRQVVQPNGALIGQVTSNVKKYGQAWGMPLWFWGEEGGVVAQNSQINKGVRWKYQCTANNE